MLDALQSNRAYLLEKVFLCCCLLVLAPMSGIAQTPEGVVPITSEPDHKIRFDNGKVRMYEVVLPKGKATLWHEHRADSFTVFFRTADVTNEPFRGKPLVLQRTPGSVGFNSTAKGPYSHRVTASGDTTFHVIALELLDAQPSGSASVGQRSSAAYKVVVENPRGRAYRLTLNPGESTAAFTRPGNTALFAISSGRISEQPEGKAPRLWDFEPAHFRWFETGEKLSLKNESSSAIELVEIEIY